MIMMAWKVLLVFSLVLSVFIHFDIDSFQAHSDTAWFLVGQTLSPGGFGQAVATDGRDILILRQFIGNTRIEFQRLILTDGLITQRANLSPPPHDAKNGTAMASDPDGNLYVLFGAGYPERRRFFSRFSAGRWVDLKETPIDQGAGNAITFVSFQEQRYLYALIGAASSQRSGAETAFLRYDLAGDQWERLPDPPWTCSDDGSSLAWDGGDFVYAFQGSNCNDEPTRVFARYYLALGLWEKLSEVPEPVDYGGSLAWDGANSLFATTGADTQFKGRGFYRYHLDTQTWDTTLPSLNCPVGDYNGNRLAIIEGRIFYWQGAPSTWTDSADCNGRGIYLFAWR